jgi:transcriptional regulator with XRE-family HTH domain
MPQRSQTLVPLPLTGSHPEGAAEEPPAPAGSWLEVVQRSMGIDGRRFGALVREDCARRKWSRGELHRRSGVPESTLAAIEKGRIASLNPLTAFAIAYALEYTTPYELLRGGPSENGDDPWFEALSKEASRAQPRRLLRDEQPATEPGAEHEESVPERPVLPGARRARTARAVRGDEAGPVRARARASGETAGAVAVAGGSQSAVGIVVMLGRRRPHPPRRGRPPRSSRPTENGADPGPKAAGRRRG